MSAKRRRGGGELDGLGGVAAGVQLPSLPTMLAQGSAAAAAAAGVLDHDGLEALGLAQEQARRRESTGSLSSKYWLSLSPQPPRHPFVGVWFPLKVFLVDSKKSLKSSWPLKLNVELLYENGEVVANQAANIEVYGCSQDRPPQLNSGGSVDLKLRILTVSMAHENKAFFLRFSAAAVQEKNLVPGHVTIMPATSTIMNVIRHRLHITEQPPNLWYKDEGGRDKCISLSALLLDEHELPVQGREVPLKVLLCYEGDECIEVKNQSILKMPLESVPKVDRYGKVHIKVRIEEVSKNHQKQAFVLKIVPDVLYSPDHGDISADVSSAITVLSKRNKRRPKRDGADEDSPELGPQPVPNTSYAANAAMFNLAPAATMPIMSTMGYKQQTGGTMNALAQMQAQGGMSSAMAQASSSTLPTITPTGGPAKPASLSQTSLNGNMMARITSADGTGTGDGGGSFSSPSFSDTISHLTNWCTHVHDLLSKIEWQHVGFEVSEDGQMNLHRPLYRCPGCWSYQDTIRQTGHNSSCKISKLSSAYRTHVHVYLQDLINMATGGSSASSTAPLLHTASTSNPNPTALASANSLMAAYSKNTGTFMDHANSTSGGAAANSSTLPNSVPHSMSISGSSPHSHIRNQFNLSSSASLSNALGGMQHTLSMPRVSSISVGGPARTASKLEPSSSMDESPDAKRQKTAQHQQQASTSSNLFPPTDWSNLAALEPISSPNALIDRGLSALGPASMMAMAGLAGTNPNQGGGGNGAPPDPNGLVGSTAFALLSAYQQDGNGGAGGNDSFSSELPENSLNLLRSGSSLNIDSLMASQSGEANVDAIHVTATPFGFPAFSSPSATAAAAAAAASSSSSAPASSSAPSSLQGFYQYDESTTFLAFVPLSRFPTIRPEQVAEMERIYRTLRETQPEQSANSRILTRAQCITLEKLKEDALLLHYAAQSSGFLSSEPF